MYKYNVQPGRCSYSGTICKIIANQQNTKHIVTVVGISGIAIRIVEERQGKQT
jgi:hypothetical protein